MKLMPDNKDSLISARFRPAAYFNFKFQIMPLFGVGDTAVAVVVAHTRDMIFECAVRTGFQGV